MGSPIPRCPPSCQALLKEEARAANVIAAGDSSIKCLAVSKDAFEEVLGPLESIMNEEANWRYKMAFAKQLKKNAVGLCNAQAEDFDIERGLWLTSYLCATCWQYTTYQSGQEQAGRQNQVYAQSALKEADRRVQHAGTVAGGDEARHQSYWQ